MKPISKTTKTELNRFFFNYISQSSRDEIIKILKQCKRDLTIHKCAVDTYAHMELRNTSLTDSVIHRFQLEPIEDEPLTFSVLIVAFKTGLRKFARLNDIDLYYFERK
ncbi:hypothetical protein EQG49_00295 [Periweissella cryptocerci]|uniref:Uncharacterized protein n=1 Tax=Periweissella cryptocerci TaxID=2506420 RepID=A0A4P6YQW5_9LACO|nr:hypothetical protein [Periweissella cryptocerci]QBO34994.1 hypothetical protein EQG49_00295 [Periweissella cryptocerci]